MLKKCQVWAENIAIIGNYENSFIRNFYDIVHLEIGENAHK